MNIGSTENFLKKFDYRYEKNENTLIIKMDFAHRVVIDFSNPDKIIIKDKLVAWNFLTGLFRMNIKKGILFNMVLGISISATIAFFDLSTGIMFFFGLMLWGLLWSILYVSKYESLRYILINWNNQKLYPKTT